MTTTSAPQHRGAALERLPAAVAELGGVDLGALASCLVGLDLDTLAALSRDEAEVVVAATQRVINAMHAVQSEAITTYADETDRRMDEYQRRRREEFVERRDAARDRGVPFTERWHPIPSPESYAASELAPLLHVSPRAMASRVRRARRLTHHLPGLAAGARRGDLEPYRTDAALRASDLLEVGDLGEFEARLMSRDLGDISCSELGRRARHAAAATDRAGVEGVAARARARRGVRCSPDPDVPGMTRWQLELPTDVSQRLWAAVDELGHEYHRARRATDDPMTLDQARADALVDLALSGAQITTTLDLVVPVAALLPHAAEDPERGLFSVAERRSPSEVLEGGGVTDPLVLQLVEGRDLHRASVLEAEIALQLMGHLEVVGNPHLTPDPPDRPPNPALTAWFVPGLVDAGRVGTLLPDDIGALLADPDTRLRVLGASPGAGTVVTDATVAYRPGRRLAARVRRRDETCRFPGCGTPAERCQLDHVRPWPEGETSEDNLVALCTSHHGFKHHAGWRLAMAADGVCTWTAPTGRQHETRPRAVHDLAV